MYEIYSSTVSLMLRKNRFATTSVSLGVRRAARDRLDMCFKSGIRSTMYEVLVGALAEFMMETLTSVFGLF